MDGVVATVADGIGGLVEALVVPVGPEDWRSPGPRALGAPKPGPSGRKESLNSTRRLGPNPAPLELHGPRDDRPRGEAPGQSGPGSGPARLGPVARPGGGEQSFFPLRI